MTIGLLPKYRPYGTRSLPLLLSCLYAERERIFFRGYGTALAHVISAIRISGGIEIYFDGICTVIPYVQVSSSFKRFIPIRLVPERNEENIGIALAFFLHFRLVSHESACLTQQLKFKVPNVIKLFIIAAGELHDHCNR